MREHDQVRRQVVVEGHIKEPQWNIGPVQHFADKPVFLLIEVISVHESNLLFGVELFLHSCKFYLHPEVKLRVVEDWALIEALEQRFLIFDSIANSVLKFSGGLFGKHKLGLSEVLYRVLLLFVVFHEFGVRLHKLIIELSDTLQCTIVQNQVENILAKLHAQNTNNFNNQADRKLQNAAHSSLHWPFKLVRVIDRVLETHECLLNFRHKLKVIKNREGKAH